MRNVSDSGPLLNKEGALATQDAEKVELLNAFFTSVITAKAGPQASQPPEKRGQTGTKEDLPLVEKEWVRDHLCKLDPLKSMDPDGMHP